MKKIKSFKLFESTQIVGWPDDKYPLLKQVIDDMITEFDDEFNGFNLEVHFYGKGGIRVEINVIPTWRNFGGEPVLFSNLKNSRMGVKFRTDEDGYDYYDFEYLSIKIKRFFEDILNKYNCFGYEFATNFHLYSPGDEILTMVIFPDNKIKESVNEGSKEELEILKDLFIPIEDDYGHMIRFDFYGFDYRYLYGTGVKMYLKDSYIKSINNGDHYASKKEKSTSDAYDRLRKELGEFRVYLEEELSKYNFGVKIDPLYFGYDFFMAELPVISLSLKENIIKENLIWQIPLKEKVDEVAEDALVEIEDEWGDKVDIIVDRMWGSRDRVISIFFKYETINSYDCGDEIYADGCINDTIAYKKLEEIMKSIVFDVRSSFDRYNKSFSILYEFPHLFYLSSSTSIIDIKIREI